jgi:tRNA dimethylallyltransferase
VLTGPTASGKTAVGIELARRLPAEVISLDSMAVYRGMNIGTAKPAPEMRAQIRHHLIDIRDPTEAFSVSQYLKLAQQKIEEIRSRGREVLFVGGTPLYLKALLRGLFDGPAADWEFRRKVEQEAEQVGLQALHDRLAQVDPLSAARLHPHDKRRIIRALEVYRLTGQPISHFQFQFDEGHPAQWCRVFVLRWPRSVLHRRIDQRVEQMFAEGLVGEVERLIEAYGALGHTAAQAVGYREVLDFLRGTRSLAETVESVKSRTRQFARRQETWFRSLSECRFVDQEESRSPIDIAEQILASAGGPPDANS